MSDILSTGASALLAFQRELATISNNVANVNTPGYSRQVAGLATRSGDYFGYGFVGSGVNVTSISRVTDGIQFARALQSTGDLASLTRLATQSGQVDKLFSDASAGIGQPVSNFFDSLQALSSDPTSNAARQGVIGNAQDLVNRFHSLQGQLSQLDNQTDQSLAAGVTDINQMTRQIATLNTAITQRSGGAGNATAPNDLLDQRDQLVLQLAGKIGVTTTTQDNGALNVFTNGGQALVLGTQAQTLTTIADPYQPTRHSLALSAPGGAIALPDSAISGELGGMLRFRHEVIDPASAQLGRIAVGIASTVNAQNHAGMDLNGALGGDIFTTPTPTVTARNDNAGSASLAASVVDASALGTGNIVMRFDGTAWSASDANSGAALTMTGAGTGASPYVVGGVAVTVSGSAAAGDRFLVQPTAQAAATIGVAITDPSKIAAASPLRGAASLANTGNGAVGPISVQDVSDPNLLATTTIQFTGPNTYTINGTGSYTYTEGTPIALNGWQVSVNGTPASGDEFTISANVAGSSDNGNARALAGLDTTGLFDGGNTSLTQGVSQLTSSIGSSARSAQYAQSAQAAIDTQITDQRNSTSGVNLDEEASDMLRFQQAYQAAAQIINIANETFQSLLAAVRG